jgi:hypothetical protein
MNDRSPQMRLVRWAAPLVTLTVAIVLGSLYGVQLVVLTLAAGALLLVICLLWGSVQALAGESELSFDEAFSMGTRSAEEEQKRAVLRALKDLDYERSVGKISEEDYHEYSARYRAEAKRLIRDLDENLAEARKQVERELERRMRKLEREKSSDEDELGEAAPAALVEASSNPENTAPKAANKPEKLKRECLACQAQNELDARFCKSCGAAMASADERLCAACPARYARALDECPACGTLHEGEP